LNLFIKPCKGFIYRLLDSKNYSREYLVFFSGLHRQSALVENFEIVVIVVSNFGITAYLLYLKEIIYNYNIYRG
ncbi:hypothetical protein P154DRAFT_451900, partial [Amniculicola lignicola CBS 123094]